MLLFHVWNNCSQRAEKDYALHRHSLFCCTFVTIQCQVKLREWDIHESIPANSSDKITFEQNKALQHCFLRMRLNSYVFHISNQPVS